MVITETAKGFEIRFPYDHRKVVAVKSIEGAWYNGKNNIWTIPRHKSREVENLKRIFGANTVRSQDILDEQYEEIPPLPELTIDMEDIGLKRPLFPFQIPGVAYCLEKKNCIIGDQMGLGKTSQAIAAVMAAKTFPCLIICPATLKLNWQKEWMDVAGKRAMVLSDKLKNTWQKYYDVGYVDVFICNYESLKKYFVAHIKKEKDESLKLKHVIFKDTAKIFKSVLIDESHRCFPYETKVLTNDGWLQIGDIVENNRTDLLVASMDHRDNSVSLKSIKNIWRNDLGQRKILRIRHNKGEFYATEDHKVFTDAGRYKKVSEIESGEGLYLLREEFLDSESWKDNRETLLKELCFQNKQRQYGSQIQNGQKQKVASYYKEMRLVRKRFRNEQKALRSDPSILQPKLLSQMEGSAAGNYCSKSVGFETAESEGSCNRNDERSGFKTITFGQNEKKQSDVQPYYTGKNESFHAGKNLSFKGRQRAINRAAKTTTRFDEINGSNNGVCHNNRSGKKQIQKRPQSLQGRYSHTPTQISNRGRWTQPQNEEVAIPGQTQNRNIECVRVESVEVYQPASVNEFGYSSCRDKIVYDLEIADNHNYFADGILVSNCKDGTTQQSKFVMGLAKDREMVLELTGTPLVNKPKDLIPQLIILDKLAEMVEHLPTEPGKDKSGYKRFLNRYCDGGNGASCLKELNYRLNKICFYRREKSEVLKDLPPKTRNVILCDISNRDEYDKAENEFVNYLREVKGCDDAAIRRKLKGEVMVKMGILKQISSKGKIHAVREHIDEVLENGEKLILFCHHREVIASIRHYYPGSVSITGADTMESRQEAVNRFQSDPRVQLIVCSLTVAGVGITLTAASIVSFVEFPWTFALCEQAEDRAHRIGQLNSVNCNYFLGENTIDRYCYYDIIQKKKSIAQVVTGAQDDVQEEIIDQLLNLFNQV